MKIIYISGKITGSLDYEIRFAGAEKILKALGHIVLNPCVLPGGLEYEQYLHINLAMVAVSDAIYMLPGWEDSPGAQREKRFAEELGKEVIFSIDFPNTDILTNG